MLAIAAGKHVLVEKPVASTVADAREMYTAAVAKGVMLQVGAYKPQRVLAHVRRFRCLTIYFGSWCCRRACGRASFRLSSRCAR